jgi:hypothetical protein
MVYGVRATVGASLTSLAAPVALSQRENPVRRKLSAYSRITIGAGRKVAW